MADWFADFVKQSPTLGVCLLVVYFAWKAMRSWQQQTLELLQSSHSAHLASKDAEIAHLREDLDALRKDRDRLLQQLNQRRDKP